MGIVYFADLDEEDPGYVIMGTWVTFHPGSSQSPHAPFTLDTSGRDMLVICG